ncbi:hypothetical protein [Psychrilyobacter sp.]|uniref:hypothetical protein n=1 Tax=Psychrilyobacter sp. TaxID=2586924 RepID=UPI00301699D6
MNIRDFIDREVTYEEAMELTNIRGSKMMELFAVANEIRENIVEIRFIPVLYPMQNQKGVRKTVNFVLSQLTIILILLVTN